MFGKTLELVKEVYRLKDVLKDEKDTSRELRCINARLQKKMEEKSEHQAAMHTLDIERAKNTIRKDMEKSLIESDLKRVEAVAKLNTYIDMDTKDERKHIQEMLKDAIKGLSAKPEITINNK